MGVHRNLSKWTYTAKHTYKQTVSFFGEYDRKRLGLTEGGVRFIWSLLVTGFTEFETFLTGSNIERPKGVKENNNKTCVVVTFLF